VLPLDKMVSVYESYTATKTAIQKSKP